MNEHISTAAEAEESHMAQVMGLPRLHEVHADPCHDGNCESDLPETMKGPVENKSPARWAYERLILYIRNFEEQLDNEHEVAMGFAGSDAGVLRIEGLGYFDPDLITFYGADEHGSRMQLIQHVTQLTVTLRALPTPTVEVAPRRIGFQLARELEDPETNDGDATSEPASGA